MLFDGSWVIMASEKDFTTYVDDFIVVAKSLNLAEKQKDILLSVFRKFIIPMEESKLEGPSPCLSSLGIEVDTASFQLRLLHDELANLNVSLSDSIQRRTISKKDLQKLTGLLFATKLCTRVGHF